jgi:hypothetical protein
VYGEEKRVKTIRKGQSTLVPSGSRASPCIETQPRFMPPAFSEWILNSSFCSLGEAKKSFD